MKHTLSLLAVAAVMIFTSCNPQYYRPNRVHTPLLSEKGQVQAYASANSLHVAASPINHLGIIGGVSGATRRYEDGFGTQRAYLAEIGAGYYGRFDSARGERGVKFIYDIYGGFGGGRINIENNPGYNWPSTGITRAFLQPGIGMRSQIFEAAFNWRFCNVAYNNFNYPPTPGSPVPGSSYMFAEPAITLRVGYRAVKLELQYVHSIPFSNINWNYEDDALNLGISMIIGGYRK